MNGFRFTRAPIDPAAEAGPLAAGGWVATERLPAAAALAAYTSGVAYQAFEERLWGTVSVGRRADLVWLDADPLFTHPHGWAGLQVRGTWLGGRPTWTADHAR
jgi:predicted amidohydrolase YtcJ